MSHGRNIAKNSLWLIVQPLVLNVISLFVIGYIARTLGQIDYGKFTFAFAFVSIFVPLTNMGLSSLTTREIAENRENAGIILGKMLLLRIILSLATVAIVAVAIILMGYPPDTRLIVYIAAATLLFNAISSTLYSAFQGFEKMEYVAYSQFISGFVLTALSVVVLFFGYRLTGLTAVYAFGSLLAMLVAIILLLNKITIVKFSLDIDYWKKSVIKGLPFFLPAIVALVGSKIGIIILSKLSGDAAVGIYGAANGLIDKLMIIPDGICTALFPALAVLYIKSQNEAEQLFKKVLKYSIIIGLPITIVTFILSDAIIKLIYGEMYLKAGIVLKLLAIYFFISFMNGLCSWTLGAIHQEKKVALITSSLTILLIALNWLLIHLYGEVGLAASSVLIAVISLIVFAYLILKHLVLQRKLRKPIISMVYSGVIIGLVLYIIKSFPIYISIPLGIMVYIYSLYLFKVVTIGEIKSISSIMRRGKVIVNEDTGIK